MILRLLPFLCLAGLAATLWFGGILQDVSLESVINARDMLQMQIAQTPLQALAVFWLTYALLVALAFPISPLLTLTGGFLLGPVQGALVSIAGSTCGGAILFLAARTGFAEMFHARLGAKLRGFAAGFREDAAAYMLFLRIAIIFPSWFVNIGTGLIGIPLKTFLWTTAAGIAPVTFAFAFIGSGLERVLAAQIGAWRACGAQANSQAACTLDVQPWSLLQPEFLGALMVLAGLTLLSVILRRRWRTKS